MAYRRKVPFLMRSGAYSKQEMQGSERESDESGGDDDRKQAFQLKRLR